MSAMSSQSGCPLDLPCAHGRNDFHFIGLYSPKSKALLHTVNLGTLTAVLLMDGSLPLRSAGLTN